MNIIRNKIFIRLITLVLIFTILLNFAIEQVSYAIALESMAIKVFITILASMGILSFVNENIGVNQFFNDFTSYMNDIKSIPDVISTLANIGATSVIENQKMKISSIIEYIKGFINYTNVQNIDDIVMDPINSKAVMYLDSAYSYPTASDITFYEEIPFAGNYHMTNSILYVGNRPYIMVNCAIKKQGGAFGPIKFSFEFRESEYGFNRNDPASIRTRFEIYRDDSGQYFGTLNLGLLQNGTTYSYSETQAASWTSESFYPIRDYLDSIDNYVREPSKTIDNPDYTKNNVAFPYTLVDYSNLVGKTVEEVLENVGSISNDAFLDQVLDLDKLLINSYTQPILDYVDGKVVSVIQHQIDDIVLEQEEQRGILTKVLEGVQALPGTITKSLEGTFEGLMTLPTILTDTVTDIFTVPDDVSIDLDPLKNLTITDRFPFSLPWDLRNAISILSASAVAPEFEFEIKGESLNIDFEEFSTLAYIARTFSTIIFLVALIIITRRFIGGA